VWYWNWHITCTLCLLVLSVWYIQVGFCRFITTRECGIVMHHIRLFICLSVYLWISNFSKPWHRKFSFAMQYVCPVQALSFKSVYLECIFRIYKFIYQGNRVKVRYNYELKTESHHCPHEPQMQLASVVNLITTGQNCYIVLDSLAPNAPRGSGASK